MNPLAAALQPPAASVGAPTANGPQMSGRTTRLVASAGIASFVVIVAAALVAPPLWSAPATRWLIPNQ